MKENKSIGKTPFVVFAILFSLSTSCISEEIEYLVAEEAGFSEERLKRIAPAMQKYIDKDLTPGILTAIMRKGKIVHLTTQGYMDVENEIPLQADAIFRIA